MAEMDLSQLEADSLIAMEKHRVDDSPWSFPQVGQRFAIPLVSLDKRESFFLDVTRGSVKLTKATFQNRTRQVIVLMRLDIDGATHRNPDGEEIPCPHLHVYKEGYGDKWAVRAPEEYFGELDTLYRAFISFMGRCNITQPPVIQGGFL